MKIYSFTGELFLISIKIISKQENSFCIQKKNQSKKRKVRNCDDRNWKWKLYDNAIYAMKFKEEQEIKLKI